MAETRAALPRFAFTVTSVLPPREAWRRIVDVAGHGQVVPLTRGSGPRPEDLLVGSRLVARTALGPFGFDDLMEVRECQPGRRVVLEKVGRVIGGTVTVDITECREGSQIRWRQTLSLPWLHCPTRRMGTFVMNILAPVLRRGYTRVVTRLLDPALLLRHTPALRNEAVGPGA